jgi:hypothetical protein
MTQAGTHRLAAVIAELDPAIHDDFQRQQSL